MLILLGLLDSVEIFNNRRVHHFLSMFLSEGPLKFQDLPDFEMVVHSLDHPK